MVGLKSGRQPGRESSSSVICRCFVCIEFLINCIVVASTACSQSRVLGSRVVGLFTCHPGIPRHARNFLSAQIEDSNEWPQYKRDIIILLAEGSATGVLNNDYLHPRIALSQTLLIHDYDESLASVVRSSIIKCYNYIMEFV